MQQYSHYDLTEDETKLLSRGLKFIPSTNKINYLELAVDTESMLLKNKFDDYTLSSIIKTNLEHAKKNQDNLTKGELKALKTLMHNNEIIILRSDKGYRTVIMDSEEYSTKLKSLITNNNYRELENNPANEIDKELRNENK